MSAPTSTSGHVSSSVPSIATTSAVSSKQKEDDASSIGSEDLEDLVQDVKDLNLVFTGSAAASVMDCHPDMKTLATATPSRTLAKGERQVWIKQLGGASILSHHSSSDGKPSPKEPSEGVAKPMIWTPKGSKAPTELPKP